MTEEQYVEHEVKLRTHDALFKNIDYKFDKIDKEFKILETKLNWIITLTILGYILQIFLHAFKLT